MPKRQNLAWARLKIAGGILNRLNCSLFSVSILIYHLPLSPRTAKPDGLVWLPLN